jgi:hypothetical protein
MRGAKIYNKEEKKLSSCMKQPATWTSVLIKKETNEATSQPSHTQWGKKKKEKLAQ